MSNIKSIYRQSNIELLRCLLMFFVVGLHYINREMGGGIGFTPYGSVNYYLLWFIESLFCIGVNGFLLIFGYFNTGRLKCNIQKSINLILVVIVYNVLICIPDIWGGNLSIVSFGRSILPLNYYIILYTTLYLVAPFINKGLDMLTKKNYQVLLVLLISLFSLWNTIFDVLEELFKTQLNGIHTISAYGDQSGYNIINFILLYIIGGYIKKYGIKSNTQKNKYLLLYFLTSFLLFFVTLKINSFMNYNSILVIAQAVFLFKYFETIEITSRKVSLVINMIASTTLGIYLIHTKKLFYKDFWSLFHLEYYCNNTWIATLFNFLISTIAMYFICFLLSYLFNKLLMPLIVKLTNPFNYEINLE